MKKWLVNDQEFTSVDSLASCLADGNSRSHSDQEWAANWSAVATMASNMGPLTDNIVCLAGNSVKVRCEYLD